VATADRFIGGAAHAQNLELSPAYEHEARSLAGQAGVQERIEGRIHDLAQDPGTVEPADLVVLHRVVCCYPDYEHLLAAAADQGGVPWSSAIHPGTRAPAPSTGCSTSALCRRVSREGRGRAALSPRTHIAVSSIGVRR
jgi:hypothetical protein